jgi:N-acetylmuramoyl-L-alanine amidase
MTVRQVYTRPDTSSTHRIWLLRPLCALILAALLAAGPCMAARAVKTTEPRTDLRTGPSRAHNRITVLPPGITLWAEDHEEGFYRIPLSPMLHAWVSEDHVRPLDRSVPRPAVQEVTDISVRGVEAGTVAVMRLAQPVAYRVTQQLQPPTLTLDLFGVRLARYGVRQLPSDRCTWAVTAEQVADRWARITFNLTFSQQRGWRVVQGDGKLQMMIRRPYQGTSLDGKVIVIDPGHGGSDNGAVGPTGVREKDVNLRIAMKLTSLLMQQGAVVRMLRDGDSAVGSAGGSQRQELEARLAASEQPDADFFLSIHNNAVGSGNAATAYGTETYYWTAMSALPARILQNHLAAGLGTKNRFVSWRPFYVLRAGDVPRVLVECAFVSNASEEKRMRGDEFADAAAGALADGLEEFFQLVANSS